MNKHGQAARFAYDPAALVAYLDTLERPTCYTDAHHGRIIRRWRRKAAGVTLGAWSQLLGDYDRSPDALPKFKQWCASQDLEPVLRDRTGRTV